MVEQSGLIIGMSATYGVIALTSMKGPTQCSVTVYSRTSYGIRALLREQWRFSWKRSDKDSLFGQSALSHTLITMRQSKCLKRMVFLPLRNSLKTAENQVITNCHFTNYHPGFTDFHTSSMNAWRGFFFSCSRCASHARRRRKPSMSISSISFIRQPFFISSLYVA